MECTTFVTREEWHEFRRTRITATDLARTVTGLYGGLPSVVAEKIYGPELVRPVEDDGEPAMVLGIALQEDLLVWAGRVLDEGIIRNEVWGDELIAASLDGRVASNRCPVEAKSQGLIWNGSDTYGNEWTDQVPLYVDVQIQVQMICTEGKRAYVPAWLRRGRTMFAVEAKPDMQSDLRSLANLIRAKYVEPKVIPDIGIEQARPFLERIRHVPIHPANRVKIAPELIADYTAFKEARGALEKLEDLAKARIYAALGDAQFGDDGGGRSVEQRTIKVKAYTPAPRPASEYKRLFLSGEKNDDE